MFMFCVPRAFSNQFAFLLYFPFGQSPYAEKHWDNAFSFILAKWKACVFPLFMWQIDSHFAFSKQVASVIEIHICLDFEHIRKGFVIYFFFFLNRNNNGNKIHLPYQSVAGFMFRA